MLSAVDARARLIAAFSAATAEDVAINDALGRVLAEPLRATRDQPPFAASAMDGYAFKAEAKPRTYAIVGESAAGAAFTRALAAGEAVRISTGAAIPDGADSVLMQEDATVSGAQLIDAMAPAGQNVRPRAGDFAAGDVLLENGRALDPIAHALAASTGCATLNVRRKPRVIVMASGEEVVPPGSAARADQVFESGSFAVCGLIERWGGAAVRGAILPDDQGAIERAAEAAFQDADFLVLIGGASVGPHDHARPALERLGMQVQFDKVAVRPGKPTWFATGPRGKVLGLPGNPASAIVCAVLFLKPVIEAMLGTAAPATPLTRKAVLAEAVGANGPRESYVRAYLDDAGALHVFSAQDSSLLWVFAKANALVVRPIGAPRAEAGEPVPYIPL